MAESNVFVRFGADIGPLKKGVDDGVTSLKKIGKTSIDVAKNIAGVTAAAAAASGAMVAMASNSAKNARELRTFAQLSNTTVKEFQAIALGAKSVGIENEKLADIFKDTQDKIGDFVANGGGPLTDFFDNIGPKVGVASDAFKGLSGPDALGLYVESLEKANLSQSEMIFYMEAIASDSSQLLPLLKNNAQGMGDIAKRANDLGLSLSDIDIKQLDNMQKTLDIVGASAGTLVDKFSVELAPIIDALAESVLDWGESFGGVNSIVESTVDGIVSGIGYAANTIRGFEVIIEGLKLAFSGASVAVNVFATKSVEMIDKTINDAKEGINSLITLANNVPGVNLDKLVIGKGALAESMRASLEAAKSELATQASQLNELMLKPLPSQEIEARLESIREKNKLEIEAEIEKQDQLAAIAQQSRESEKEKERTFGQAMADIKSSWGDQQTSAVGQMFSDLATLTQSGNKRMFEIGKAAARVNTVISTYEGAQKAYTSLAGIPVVGPALGAAAAAAAIAAGGIRLQAINSTSFGGGGSVSSAGSAGGGSAAAATAAAPQAPEQNRTVRIEGFDSGQLFTGDQLNNLAEKLVELQDDGFKLVV
uniref:Tail tape measure protein n=1 Tax=uncultured marine virus TaxID=186617 RepID=A0A0F7L5I3_9VIRU|nr:hypothetical protein [uncultured marine virus]